MLKRLHSLIAAKPTGSDSRSAGGEITLREVLRRNWEELWYQPKIDLRSKRLVGAEGLIRARRPDGSVIPPLQFLQDAKEDEMLVLTERVIVAALRDFEDYAALGASVKLSVNVPVTALVKLPIAEILREERPRSPTWPGLILEITEDEGLNDLKIASDLADELRALDCTLALDDFGAGFSSLARFRQLPFAELKIDRSYVTNCEVDRVNAGLCETIVALGKRFGLKTVAEGIETLQASQTLEKLGCDFGQGFLFARPMPKADFLGALRARMVGGPRPAEPLLSGPAKLLRGLFADA